MLAFVRGERCDRGIRHDAPVAPAEDEFTSAERTQREYAQAFRARIANFDVDDHSASANAVSHAAS